MLREHAIRTGEFVLASGRRSEWYVDGRLITFRGDCVEIVGRAVVEALDTSGGVEFDAVGGLAIGADPVTVAVALASGARGFAVRKEAKDHGGGGRLAGVLEPGDRVVITEDAVTRGTSILEAVHVVRRLGAEVVGAIAVVDRGGACADLLEPEGVPFAALVTAEDLGFAYEGA